MRIMPALRRRGSMSARWCWERSFVVEAVATADTEIGGGDIVNGGGGTG